MNTHTSLAAPPAAPVSQKPTDYKTLSKVPALRSASPETMGRASFSSVRENDDGIAQTFTKTKVSSYAPDFEEAVDDNSSEDVDMATVDFVPPVTQPFSKLHGNLLPISSFKGWKQISVHGRAKTRSFGDLQSLRMTWHTPPSKQPKQRGRYDPGKAPLERLPTEMLSAIIGLLVIDIPPNGILPRNADLMALLQTSRSMHAATLDTLYQRITIPHSRIYKKFLAAIKEHPSLGTIVRRLDFSHFNPNTIFSTAQERNETKNLTAETLLECFKLTPYLHEFLAQEYIEDDLSAEVLQKLLTGLPRLQALDLCGCASAKFRDAFVSLSPAEWPSSLPITRLSLHKCFTLPPSVLEALLPRLTHATHLDLAATKVTDKALHSIPATARLTHLNLAKCRLLSADAVIDFVGNHPAARSLVFLSVAADRRSHELLDVEEVGRLIPALPPTLKSLSLKGSKMHASHLGLLRPLTRSLEELALGRCLEMEHVDKLLLPDAAAGRHSLRYLDLSDLGADELDLPGLVGGYSVLRPASAPLEVIEVSEDLGQRVGQRDPALRRAGWFKTEVGSRLWIVRESPARQPGDDGQRPWKMGAESWGMRKVPVARAEVGGMYGSFMFGRKL